MDAGDISGLTRESRDSGRTQTLHFKIANHFLSNSFCANKAIIVRTQKIRQCEAESRAATRGEGAEGWLAGYR